MIKLKCSRSLFRFCRFDRSDAKSTGDSADFKIRGRDKNIVDSARGEVFSWGFFSFQRRHALWKLPVVKTLVYVVVSFCASLMVITIVVCRLQLRNMNPSIHPFISLSSPFKCLIFLLLEPNWLTPWSTV
jgi:hypothetical protein